MVDTLEALGIGVLFVIGGDGTFRGAMPDRRRDRAARPADRGHRHPQDDRQRHPLHRPQLRLRERRSPPRSTSIRSAHVEATGARNGIGLVKLMGRHSGFIACHAALASTDVDFVLIPEVPLRLDGRARLARAPGAAARASEHTR